MRRAAILGLLVAVVGSSAAVAQEPAPLQPGQRVRVRSTVAHAPVLTGAVESIGRDTLIVRREDGAAAGVATAIPFSGIAQLQVSQGRHSRWVRGMLIGAGVGAVAGAIIGAATYDEDDWLFSTGENAVLGALLFTPIGALTGAVIGLQVKTERWEGVPLDRVRPAVGGGAHGRVSFGIAVAL
jgi:hypothetical protein